jgi:hypothetical protein
MEESIYRDQRLEISKESLQNSRPPVTILTSPTKSPVTHLVGFGYSDLLQELGEEARVGRPK